jgi:hypothetical protein
MQPAEMSHPIYKAIFGIVALASLFNIWLLHSLTQTHCAQLNLGLVKITIGTLCPLSSQNSAPLAVAPKISP